jgi:hypothetical protein
LSNFKSERKLGSDHFKEKIPESKLSMGSLTGKFPVILDNGRTIIYIADSTKEEETRLKYELLKNSRGLSGPKKTV